MTKNNQQTAITGCLICNPLLSLGGHAMTQAVKCQTLTVEAQIQRQAKSHGICDGRSWTGTCLSQSISGFHYHRHLPTLHIHVSFIYHQQ